MLFSDVVAQTELSSRLREGIRSGKVAHAQLFDGAEGSGALALARAYANIYIVLRELMKTLAVNVIRVLHIQKFNTQTYIGYSLFSKRIVPVDQFQIHFNLLGGR